MFWTRITPLRHYITWPVLVLVLCYSYLGFHMLSSRMGMWQLHDYQTRIEAAQSKLDNLSEQHESLEKQTARLRSSSLDLDTLDEEARRLLNVSQPKEIVIWLDESQ